MNYGREAFDMVARIVGAVLLTLVIFHVVAFAVYVSWSAVTGLEPTAAGDSPGMFMLSVFVQKLGHALTFVLMFCRPGCCAMQGVFEQVMDIHIHNSFA